MTVETVKIIAARFLASEIPEVLALKGAWGVGKTFAWNQLVQQQKKRIKLANYCYVSLFGISSIRELRTTIFAKTRSVSLLGEKLDAKAINNQWGLVLLEQGKKWFQASSSIIKELPYGRNVSVALETLAPHLIRNSIICLDDFERTSIAPDELLGFISELKEEKNCKVVLIFNEDKLGAKETYEKYREKVVDIELLFSPTAEEAAELSLPSSLVCRDKIKKCAMSLDIKNIRILRKIVSLTNMMHTQVGDLHAGVLEQAVTTLVLLTWCYYSSDETSPTFEFIRKWNQVTLGEKVEDPKHAVWATVLQNYGWTCMDEFDLTISKVIEHGYLEETGFAEEAEKAGARIRANELEQSFTKAWGLFHHTFADNRDELIKALAENFKKYVSHITPLNLNGTIRLLRELDRSDIADQLLDSYMETHAGEERLFDLDAYPFSEDITDEAMRKRFKEKLAEKHAPLTLVDAVRHIAEHSGWSSEHIEALNAATEDDYYDLFKLDHGHALRKVVQSCLQFAQWENHKAIGQKARAALMRIGQENQLNAIRVARYGIQSAHQDVAAN